MIYLAIQMALTEIRRNALRSALTMLGVIIGVAAVVTMLTLGQSATAKVSADVASLGTNLLMVMPGEEPRGPPSGVTTPFERADVHAIVTAAGPDAEVAPSANGSAVAVVGATNHKALITGTWPEYLGIRGYKLASGRVFDEADELAARAVCVIGETVRSELFVGDPLGQTMRLGRVSCTVVGVLAAKGQAAMGGDQDDVVLMPLSAFQQRISGTDEVGMVFLGVQDAARTDRVIARVEGSLRERRRVPHGDPDNFHVRDARELAQTLGTVTKVLTAFLGAVGGVSLLVGGIGIMNIMLVSVTERTREIGIRLAIGARPNDILTQFLVESVVLSVLGGVIGIALGLGASFGITWVMELSWSPSPTVLAVAFLFCVLVGVGFGFLPARRASQLDPLEALRHE